MFKLNYLQIDYEKLFKNCKSYIKKNFSLHSDPEYTLTYKEIFIQLFIEKQWFAKSPIYSNNILFRYVILGLTNYKVYWFFINNYYTYAHMVDDKDALSSQIRKNFIDSIRFIMELRRTRIIWVYFYHNYIFRFKALVQLILYNIKWVLLASLIAGLYFIVSLFFIQIEFTKQAATWYLLMVAYYLLMSTFNSFVSKYRYSKFTTAIQRFWKRTGIIFWILEGFLFILFFYYFLNSSQEPLYMFDYSNLNQDYLFQLKLCYKSLLWLTIILILCYVFILNNNWLSHYQSIFMLMLISLCVFYTLYMESYQFVYVFTLLQNKSWVFDETDQLWALENEQNNIRTKQQYFILCLVGKYWHFVFIFISWFFFLVKSLEVNKINITLMAYNIQNIIILYWLNVICFIQWLKFVYKKFFELSYSWFYFQFDEKFFAMFSLEFWYTLTTFFYFDFDVTLVKHIIITSQTLCHSNETVLWKYIKV